MNPQMQAQIGVLFEREARDAKGRDHAESRRLQDVGARLRRTSGFDGDPFDPIRDHVPVVAGNQAPTWQTADLPPQAPPPPPPRPAIPWGPTKPAPPPKPTEAPCPKC